jgi:hypothetical protein
VIEIDGRVLDPGGDEFGLGVWPKAIEAENKRTEKQRAEMGNFMKWTDWYLIAGLRILGFHYSRTAFGNSDIDSILRTWLYIVDPAPFQWR